MQSDLDASSEGLIAEEIMRVKRPISFKIFGITGLLLVLMATVTVISNLNMKRVNDQLSLLSDFYIPLDQFLGDIRVHSLLQSRSLERAMEAEGDFSSFDKVRRDIKDTAGRLGDCEYEKYSVVQRELREQTSNTQEKSLISFEVHNYCANRKATLASNLAKDALKLSFVDSSSVLITQFIEFDSQIREIQKTRDALTKSVEKYATGEQKGAHEQAMALMKEKVEEDRRSSNRSTAQLSRLLHQATSQAADKVHEVEREATRLNWAVTTIAIFLGVFFATLITRNVTRPVRDLLKGARSVERGDLNISVSVNSADEIEQLAQSFNYMVSGLREKKAITETFGKYVDPRIVKRMLHESTFSDAGNKCLTTVLFSDIEGFTSLCEQLSADAVVRLLNSYFSTVSKAVLTNHGIIDKYIGDSLMAFWAPPFIDERDQSLAACKSALQQLALLTGFRKKLPDITGLRRGIPTFNIRIGICTGEATTGSVGSESAKGYTVIGDTVNIASRLESANKSFGTRLLISEGTQELAADSIEVRDLGLIRVSGKDESLRIFELLGLKGETESSLLILRDLFEAAMKSFKAQDWDKAEAQLQICAEHSHSDGPTRFYLQVVRRYKLNPPPSNWAGVLELAK